MPRIHSIRRKPAAAASAMIVAGLLLAACGGSSSTSSSTGASAAVATSPSFTTAASGNTATTPGAGTSNGAGTANGTGGTTVPGAANAPKGSKAASEAAAAKGRALAACLRKNGIPIGERKSGASQAQLQAALKQCGLGSVHLPSAKGGRTPLLGSIHVPVAPHPPAITPINSAQARQAASAFAACMRENGVNLPAPSSSGQAPLIDTKGIDTHSAQFRAAESKCLGRLHVAAIPVHVPTIKVGSVKVGPPTG